jgi:Arc/MetJ-type ribon-helix-helix transcriptional regulator
MTLNVRVSGPLCDFIAANVGDEGTYENIAEYIRDLVRRDKARTEREALERLRLELPAGLAARSRGRRPAAEDEMAPAGRRHVLQAET